MTVERLMVTRAASYWYARDPIIWKEIWNVLDLHGIHPKTPVTVPDNLVSEIQEAVKFIEQQEECIAEINRRLKQRKK